MKKFSEISEGDIIQGYSSCDERYLHYLAIRPSSFKECDGDEVIVHPCWVFMPLDSDDRRDIMLIEYHFNTYSYKVVA